MKTPVAGTATHDELLNLLVGGLSATEAAQAEEHVRQCADCTRLRGSLGEAAMFDSLEPVAAPAGALERLLKKATPDAQLDFLVPQLMSLFDLPEAEVRELLARAARDDAWDEGPGPDVKVLMVNAGPRCAEHITALVKVKPGGEFPHHEHPGRERVMVLQGGYRDEDGREFWRGEMQTMCGGSAHYFRALDGVTCICAAVNSMSTDDEASSSS